MMTYSSNKIPSLILVFVVSIVVFVGCAVLGAGLGDAVEGILDDRGDAHTERMREMETEQERQDAREAEAAAQEAEAQVEIERERALQEQAKQRQMEYQVEWQRAAGDRAEADANAYNTRRMSDAAYHAIQRQGRLLTLSVAQQYFFGGVMGLALVTVAGVALVVMNARKEKRDD